jgi:hypothetical protein
MSEVGAHHPEQVETLPDDRESPGGDGIGREVIGTLPYRLSGGAEGES